MEATITRTVHYTDLHYIKIVDGKPVEFIKRIYESVKDESDAVKKLAKAGISNVAVVSYEAGSNAYKMTVAEFIEHANEIFEQMKFDDIDDGIPEV
jgi:uncharacterized protein YoxC